jgi:hypothetical protein
MATGTPCPLVTEQSILGVWEAVYTADTVRVFRLELHKDKPSLLAQGLPYGKTFVSVLTGKSIAEGRVKLRFKDSMGPLQVVINNQPYTMTGEDLLEGTGRLCPTKRQGSGVLEVTLTNEPASPDPKQWQLRFIRPEKGELVNELREMSRAAREAARRHVTR